MTCYHPRHGYRTFRERTESGKFPIVWSPPSGPCEPVTVACGQCIGCRLDRSRDWALRCVHESSLWKENSFVTLTYDDSHLPDSGSLNKAHHQKFFREMRSKHMRKIRYFLCGEYGDQHDRPHYHAILFNIDFPDKQEWGKNKQGDIIYTSQELHSYWPHGLAFTGNVTWQSAAYVARYILKKANGEVAFEKYVRDVDPETGEIDMVEPEYIAMSRRPGIGSEWFKKWKADCRKNFLTHDDTKMRIPKYYDTLMERTAVETYNAMRRERKERVAQMEEDKPRRLAQREEHQQQLAKRLKRSL